MSGYDIENGLGGRVGAAVAVLYGDGVGVRVEAAEDGSGLEAGAVDGVGAARCGVGDGDCAVGVAAAGVVGVCEHRSVRCRVDGDLDGVGVGASCGRVGDGEGVVAAHVRRGVRECQGLSRVGLAVGSCPGVGDARGLGGAV